MPCSSLAVSYEHNKDGLRTKKTVTVGNETTVTEYLLHRKNVMHLTRGTDELHFYHDAQDKPAEVIFNGVAYGYLYNLQGDVVALVDGTGAKVVEYSYDAWGKPISKTGSLAGTLGTLQPFRYRGYLWDWETGDYYCWSRQYRSAWGRFLNADVLIAGNIYKYCSNDPISREDRTGCWDYSRYKTNIVDSFADFLERVIEYSIENKNNPSVRTVSEFLEACDATAEAKNLLYTRKKCAAAIAHHLVHGMSHTAMTPMLENDIIVAIPIQDPTRNRMSGLPSENFLAGAVLMEIDWNDNDGYPVNHGGIVVWDLNAYQSSRGSKYFCHQDLYIQPWTHMGWHKGVRLDDWMIPLMEEYLSELRRAEEGWQ